MQNTYKHSLVITPGSRLEIEATRDEQNGSWRVTVYTERGSTTLLIPATFDTDKRTAREFVFDLIAVWWPASSEAEFSRKWRAKAKRNRHKPM